MLEAIKELKSKEPFVPFQIVLTNGDRYTVNAPDLLVIMERSLFLAEPRSDRFKLLRLNQVAAAEGRSAAA